MLLFILLPAAINAITVSPTLSFYGISYKRTVEEYQQEYLGKVVKYIPQSLAEPNENDITYFRDLGGNFDSEYIISKIAKKGKKILFHLQEKGTDKIIKFEFYNVFSVEGFYLTSSHILDITLPLILIDEFNKDVSEYKGKVIGENLVISDYNYLEYSKSSYPAIALTVTDNSTGKNYYTRPESREDLEAIGKTFTNPKFKCIYTVVGVSHNHITSSISDDRYEVLNSINKETKKVAFSRVDTDIFKGDGDSHFIATLQKVEKPSNSEVRYGETKEITDKNITKFSYIDNFIDIIIVAGHSQFDFIIKNVSESTIKVVWNEAVFVDVDGSTSKVMHLGTKYSQREGDQPASTIIKGAKLEDIAAPTKNVYYSDVLKEWTSYSLYVSADKDATDQTIKLMLPIQVKDVINEYIFEFGLTYKLKHPELVVEE